MHKVGAPNFGALCLCALINLRRRGGEEGKRRRGEKGKRRDGAENIGVIVSGALQSLGEVERSRRIYL